MGTDMRVLQHLMGHARIETTAKYVRVSGRRRREALERINLSGCTSESETSLRPN